jgi:hypothetical protein
VSMLIIQRDKEKRFRFLRVTFDGLSEFELAIRVQIFMVWITALIISSCLVTGLGRSSTGIEDADSTITRRVSLFLLRIKPLPRWEFTSVLV